MVNFNNHSLTVLLLFSSTCFILISIQFIMEPITSVTSSLILLALSSTPVELCLICDNVSLTFSCVVTFISGWVFIFSQWYIREDPYVNRFIWILLSFVIAINILIFSGSIITLIIGWDGLGVSSFALIIYYQSGDSLGAGFLTLLINRIGDVILISMIFYLVSYGCTNLFNYSLFNSYVILLLLTGAAITNSAQYPFSAWLPAAIAAPTPVSALVHSSTLVTAGIYIVIRAIMTTDFPNTILTLFLFCGSVTSLLGGVCAIYENDINKIVAYSTLSQLGIIVYCLGLGSLNLSLLHLYTHAIFNALLFLTAGSILLLSYGVQDIRIIASITNNSPLLMVFFNISTLCLMGFPFLSAFYSNHSIILLIWSSNVNMFSLILMFLATLMTSIYIIRLLNSLNWDGNGCALSNYSQVPLFFIPLVGLFSGSLLLGWFFTTIDLYYYDYSFVPFNRDVSIYVTLLAGLSFGLLLSNTTSYTFVSSLLFSDPSWRFTNTATFNISTALTSLEYGWVEPQTYSVSVICFTQQVRSLIWWPNATLNFSGHAVTAISITILLWLLLK